MFYTQIIWKLYIYPEKSFSNDLKKRAIFFPFKDLINLITFTSWWAWWRLKSPAFSLLNGLFRRRSKKTLKLHVIGLFEVNSPVTGEFPAQRASNAKIFLCCFFVSMRVALKHPKKDLESNDTNLLYQQLYQHNVNHTLYSDVQSRCHVRYQLYHLYSK